MPRLPTKWRRARSPNTPRPPMPSITKCRRHSSPRCSARTANIRAASTRGRHRRCGEAEEEALRQTVEHADLADGQSVLELGCGWGSLSLWMARQFPSARHHRGVEFAQPARLYRAGRGGAGPGKSSRRHRRHERVRARAAVRPHRLGRDVRAHDQLAGAADAAAILARAGRPLLPARLYPSCRRLSVRSGRPGRLDRAAFLHRRRDAEPSI